MGVGLVEGGVDGVGDDIKTGEFLAGDPGGDRLVADHLALEVLEDLLDAVAVRAFLAVDGEGSGDDEAGVAGASLALVGLEGLVLADVGDRSEGEDVGRVQALEVGGQQVRLLDGEERREDARDGLALVRRCA